MVDEVASFRNFYNMNNNISNTYFVSKVVICRGYLVLFDKMDGIMSYPNKYMLHGFNYAILIKSEGYENLHLNKNVLSAESRRSLI